MRKLVLCFVCLAAMLAAGTSLKAQEMTMELYPGWTWISYPSTDTLDLATAFGSFTPAAGDYIKSQAGYAEYYAGYGWYGSLSTFWPCKGYMYKSNRTEPVVVTLNIPLPQQTVTTAEPTDITATSAIVGSTVTIGEDDHIFARGVCWGTEQMPDVNGNRTTDATVTGSQTVTLNGLTPNTTYYVRAYVATDYGLAYGNQQSFATESGGGGGDHIYVDLGLPSGTLWAICNVGANAPEDYGDYFAWGETMPKDTYNWDTYQYGIDLTKYTGYDGLTTLLPEDDAATANWGSDWRMPTDVEWQELLDNTTSTGIQQNGVNGRLFTAANGNSLFLPVAGYHSNSSLYNDGGYYWSSLRDGNWSYADNLDCGLEDAGLNAHHRYYGFSVRPVRSFTNYSLGVENVINGDFEQGNVGFTSDYEYADYLNEGMYNVDSNVYVHHHDFVGVGHGGLGCFMIINGAMEPGVNVWTEQITVSPNTYYAFSTWVCTLVAQSEALLQFSINGTQIGEVFTAPQQINTWQQFYVSWYSGNSTTATITILNQNTEYMGNDFGLDDISFREILTNP